MNQFVILLYKNYLLRKRNYVITICELFLPLIFASLPVLIWKIFDENPEVLFLNQKFNHYYEKNDTQWPTMESVTFQSANPFQIDDDWKKGPLYVLFSPSNNLTRNFTEDVIALWKNKSEFTGSVIDKAFPNTYILDVFALLYRSFLSEKFKCIAIVYENMEDELPKDLLYTIRSDDSNLTFLEYKHSHSILDFTYYHHRSYYLGFQVAVEQTYIQYRMTELNNSFTFSISLMEFPKFQKTEKQFAHVINNVLKSWPFVFSFGFFLFSLTVTHRLSSENVNGMQVRFLLFHISFD